MGNPKRHIMNPQTGNPLCRSDTKRVTLVHAEVTCRTCLTMHKNNAHGIKKVVAA